MAKRKKYILKKSTRQMLWHFKRWDTPRKPGTAGARKIEAKYHKRQRKQSAEIGIRYKPVIGG